MESPAPDLSRRGRVITNHRQSYPDPLIVIAGEDVTIGERDTRWPYTRCISRQGTGGWVPNAYVRVEDGKRGRILQDFDSTELTVSVDEELTITPTEGRWVWCANGHGQSGRVPKENVAVVGDGVQQGRHGLVGPVSIRVRTCTFNPVTNRGPDQILASGVRT